MANITYKTEKSLPCKPLYDIFAAVGWADSKKTTDEMFRSVIYDLAVLPAFQR